VTWVKVCGLTRTEDVEAAIAAGADAIGLVLVASSPRAVTIDQAADLAEGVEAQTFLLTYDLNAEDIVAAALAAGVDGVQPYGRYAEKAAEAAAGAGLLVLRPALQHDLRVIPGDQLLLFDRTGPGGLGGTGVAFDLGTLPVTDRRFVLAGGLGPDNVADVVRKVRPYGVDASSGLEVRPGIKDHTRVARFVREAKQA
jgi:phosphoribosylanthranilate isomerase